MSKKKSGIYILLFFILLKFILQYLLINPVYDLHRDEYLHLDQANHLAAGFQSVPPFTSLIALLIKWLGNSFFWIKFFPALFGALTLVVVWKLTEALGGNLYALILGAAAITFSVMLRINILFQPNSADILFWTLCYYYIVKFIQTSNGKFLIWCGIFFGIGFLNKYNIGFLAAGLVPALLVTQYRKIFLNKYLYYGGLAAFLIMLPNIIWQVQNHFPVISHMKELADTQLVNVQRSDFIISQVLFFCNSLFIFIAAFYSFLKYRPFFKYRVILLSYIFTIAIFIYLKAKDYYALGLYPVLIPFGCIYIEELLTRGFKKRLRYALVLIIVILFTPIAYIGFPIYKPENILKQAHILKPLGLLRWEDGKDHPLPQDFADMLGWHELAIKVDSQYSSFQNKKNTLVLCANYGETGAINYYSSFKNINAVSFNADYIHWFPLKNKIENIIWVDVKPDEDSSTIEIFKKIFHSVVLTDSITNPFAREEGTRIYLLKNPAADINNLFQKKLKEMSE